MDQNKSWHHGFWVCGGKNLPFFMKQISYFFGKEGLENMPLSIQSSGYSSFFGIMLVGLGVLMGFCSFLKYKQIEKTN